METNYFIDDDYFVDKQYLTKLYENDLKLVNKQNYLFFDEC